MRNKLKADLLAAKANQRRAYLNYEKSILNAFTEVYTATNTIYNLSEMVKLKQQEAETIKQAVNTVSELFAAGRATYLEVITVQKSALQSQLDLIEYEKRQQLATVNLYRAVGGGW
jgi:outer membrane protein TolC